MDSPVQGVHGIGRGGSDGSTSGASKEVIVVNFACPSPRKQSANCQYSWTHLKLVITPKLLLYKLEGRLMKVRRRDLTIVDT